MYINKKHRLDDVGAIFSLIETFPLGAWVHHSGAGLVANHIPFLLDRTRGPSGTLIGHVARANDIWRELDPASPSIVMFQGPQAYITPNWYPGKAEHGKVVPTWDYAVAHAHGIARVVEDRDWLLDMLNRLTNEHEASQPVPWRVADAPAEYIDKLLGAIVGIEIPIDRLEGKLKASQDEALRDRLGTITGLRHGTGREAALMAELVQKAVDGQ